MGGCMNNEKRKSYYLKDLSKISKDDLPTKLYRYRPGNSVNCNTNELFDIEALSSNKIWLSRADEFNDPFDSLFRVNGEIMDSQDITFAASFAESCTDICMWSYYANYHKGFCLEYDFKDLGDVHPIYYADELDVRIEGMHSAFVKSSVWKNEKEWRFTDQKYATENRYNKGYLIEFVLPKAILLGYNCKDAILISKLLRVAEDKKIALYQMGYDKEKNELVKKINILRF